VQAVTLAVLLEGEQLALLGIAFEIVETGDGLCGVLEREVAGDVVNPFGPDIDGPPSRMRSSFSFPLISIDAPWGCAPWYNRCPVA
jgi:hypothetical protein